MTAPAVGDRAAEAEAIQRFLRDREAEMTAQLCEWIRIPSVSSVPEHSADVRRSASWLAGQLTDLGFPHAEVWDTGGVRRMSGLRAHLAANGRSAPAVTVKLIAEGEEESGSSHLDELLKEHSDRLGADLVVYSDTLLWRLDAPAVCLGVRGTVGAHLEIYGPSRDVHRGVIAGAAPNPCCELCRLLGQLHDGDGRVTLPGFYDDVAPVPDAERAAIAALRYTDEDWLTRTQSRSISGEPEYSVLERVWTRPSVEVLSITGGDPAGPSRGPSRPWPWPTCRSRPCPARPSRRWRSNCATGCRSGSARWLATSSRSPHQACSPIARPRDIPR